MSQKITLTVLVILLMTSCKKEELILPKNQAKESVVTENSEPILLANTADYKVYFEATWDEATYPDNYPSANSPHFSPLIGMTHTSDTVLFAEGNLASAGIKKMAEVGGRGMLRGEIQNMYASSFVNQSMEVTTGQLSPGFSADLFFTADSDYPNLSLVTMLAPSPDWFVALENLDLYENDVWVDSLAIPVNFAYDAGTDDGTDYLSPNQESMPHIPIYKITEGALAPNCVLGQLGIFYVVKQ